MALSRIKSRRCHESAMNMIYLSMAFLKWSKVPWISHENGMKCLEPRFWGCRQSAMKVPWLCHSRFMADSWYFQPNIAPNNFMPFSWHFHGTFLDFFQNCHNWFYHLYVCLFVLILFSLMVFAVQVDHFFAFFLWSKFRLTRNTQTTKPNPQLMLCWLTESHGECCKAVSSEDT